MSVFAAIGAYDRGSDWLLASAGLFVVFIVIYPLYILYLRYTHTRGIRKQLVTSMYKLPIAMTPTELAYIFSAQVRRSQLFATVYDLTNRSVLIMHEKHGIITVETGPKIDNNLHSFEKLLMQQIDGRATPVAVRRVLDGISSYELDNGKKTKINGSRQYVFWWLLRETLRKRGIIQRNLSKRYAMMLFSYGVLGSLVVCVATVGAVRFSQIVFGGQVDADRMMMSFRASMMLWLMAVIPMIFVTYGLFKFKGRMLGRDWILTRRYRRYLGQMDAYREFVRMTHKGLLKFESKELQAESLASTRPYAIACGYIKK